jgi:glycerol uptake facilitator-like aquaporin
MVFGQF